MKKKLCRHTFLNSVFAFKKNLHILYTLEVHNFFQILKVLKSFPESRFKNCFNNLKTLFMFTKKKKEIEMNYTLQWIFNGIIEYSNYLRHYNTSGLNLIKIFSEKTNVILRIPCVLEKYLKKGINITIYLKFLEISVSNQFQLFSNILSFRFCCVKCPSMCFYNSRYTKTFWFWNYAWVIRIWRKVEICKCFKHVKSFITFFTICKAHNRWKEVWVWENLIIRQLSHVVIQQLNSHPV